MTTTKALEILKYHNDWRRGLHDVYHYTPTEIGEAIDLAIHHMEFAERLIKLQSDLICVTQSTTNYDNLKQ